MKEETIVCKYCGSVIYYGPKGECKLKKHGCQWDYTKNKGKNGNKRE